MSKTHRNRIPILDCRAKEILHIKSFSLPEGKDNQSFLLGFKTQQPRFISPLRRFKFHFLFD